MNTPSGDGRERVVGLDSGVQALRDSPEFRGPVEPTDGHDHANDHFALVYEGERERFAAAVPFLREGLERGEKCLYVGESDSLEAVEAQMRARGLDVDAGTKSGALEFDSVEDTYLRGDSFDVESTIDLYESAIESATEDYEALRVVAETNWIAEGGVSNEEIMEYERRVNDLLDDADAIALCQYDREAIPAEALVEIVRVHPHLVYDATVSHNVYYTPPEEVFGRDRPDREVDRMLGTLGDRARAKASLRDHTETLRETHEVTARTDLSFEEKLQRLFEIGCERFDLDLGAMALVDPNADTFEIEHVSGDHDRFEPGFELPLSETYCTATADERDVVGIDNPVEAGYGGLYARETLGVEAYLGTYVPVEGGRDRTFFFVAEGERDRGFTEEERAFQRAMGQWIEYELGRRQREAAQRALYEITANSELAFDRKLERLLELGRERFDLDVGFLAHASGGRFEIVDAVGSHELIQPGRTADRSGTYCRRVLETDGLVDVQHASDEEWADDPAFETDGLESYIGTTVTIGDERYGTLCFASREPRGEPFSGAERTFLELTAQWVSYELEREQRQAQLAALNEMSRDLMDAETDVEIGRATADHAEASLGLPVAAVVRYDRDEGRLETAGRTDRAADELPLASLCATPSGRLWDAFTAGSERIVTDLRSLSGAGETLSELAAVPLGPHGVFVAATEAAGGFSAAELDFVRTTAATVETALGRADRERLLQEREQTLEEQNESLERLNRINDTIRTIGQSLVQASTRAEIEAVVCEQLADVGPYELAWICEYDAVTDRIAPREWAGAEKGYLDAVSATADESLSGRGPAGAAARTHGPRVVDNVVDDPDFEPWRREALGRGYHSLVALPLVYGDALYGVLNVYANQPGVFDELEASVLTELADTIAYAVNAVESKKAIVSDEVIELEFAVEDRGLEIVELARETGADLEMEGIVLSPGGRSRIYMSARGARPEEILASVPDLPATEGSLVSEYESDDGPVCLFEAELSADSLCETVRDHGGRPQGVSVEDGVATVTVELAADADVREFVGLFLRNYPDSELVARRSAERPRQTPVELRAALTDELTDRQLEVLQTAYFGGYFETPRTQTGSEIAESMGITQPTFNTHARAAQRKLCRQLFEADGVVSAGD